MAVLLIGANGRVGEALLARLLAQGDEVRVIEPFEELVDAWREAGAHVAPGRPDDPDLVARAAQGVRTIVVVADDGSGDTAHVMESVVAGGHDARIDRIVLCGWDLADAAVKCLTSSDIDHVVLDARRKKLLGRNISPQALAEAIDAADDLAGTPRFVLDLGQESAWTTLGLKPPR